MILITVLFAIFVSSIQSTESTSSNAMEIDGLKRCLTELEDNRIKVGSLTTDRHPTVESEMKKPPYNTIVHYFDTWHVVKGKSDLCKRQRVRETQLA